jgi:hypothetical protein
MVTGFAEISGGGMSRIAEISCGRKHALSTMDAANPAIYLWLCYSLWELTV